MKHTTHHQFNNDDTIICPNMMELIQTEMIRHASMELCESIVTEIEFRALCELIRIHKPVDMTEHAVLEN